MAPSDFLLSEACSLTLVKVLWGTMVSSVAATRQQAILLVFVQAMVYVARPGYLMPVRDMSGIFTFLAQFVPLNYYLVFVRSVVPKGAGLMDMWPQLAALVGLGFVVSVIASFTVSRHLIQP